MPCPLCGKRQARRACPALGRAVCAVCCGTKRLVAIACPETCAYLVTAKVHPPAVVRRQQEHDLALLMPAVEGLTESQVQLLWLVLAQVTRQPADAFTPLRDEDVTAGVAALVATLETAERGVIYEHRPATLPAQRVVADLNALFAQLAQRSGRPVDRDAGIVLKRVAQLADAVRRETPGGAGAFLGLAARLARATASEDIPGSTVQTEPARPSIILL
jgi:hypothetical protein